MGTRTPWLAWILSGILLGVEAHFAIAQEPDRLQTPPPRGFILYGIALPTPCTDTDFIDNGTPDPDKVELGRLLFFDKIISGNRNISCATCHHPLTATTDWLSLPVGEGGKGLGPTRTTGEGASAIVERVPRNAPHVFNLGAREFTTLFHDGRLFIDPSQPSGYFTPAGDQFPSGIESPVAAQAMFPITSSAEMAGQPGENPIADATAAHRLDGDDGVWHLLAMRLQGIDEYVQRFMLVYDDITTSTDITFGHAANAIGAFEAAVWRFDNAPFDRYLRGEVDAMSPAAIRGMNLFYGPARCSTCHSGVFQTDHKFHAIAMPQIGPGKGDGPSKHEDFGYVRVTHNEEDLFKFRTPTLRNVPMTGPWGHAGAFNTLEAVVRHHLDPVASLDAYDPSQAVLPSRPDLDAIDFLVHNDPNLRLAIAEANELKPSYLNDRQVADLIDFLFAIMDPAAQDMRNTIPASVPSGLPVYD